MKVKQKKCRICKTHFKPLRSVQIVCSLQCAIDYSKVQQKKHKARLEANKRKRIREEKQKLKTLTQWKNDLQKVINSIVRELDKGKPCIIRPNENVKRFDASHYYSRGSAEYLRFSVKNIFLGGTKSNRELGGEPLLMRQGIIREYGQGAVDELDKMYGFYSGLRLRIHDIKRCLKIARQILRELKSGKVLTRHEIDLRIGIYDKH